METKGPEDYIEELCDYFPQIDEEEMKRIVAPMVTKLSMFMSSGRRGYSVTSRKSFFNGKRGTFTVSNIYGKGHLAISRIRKKFIINKNKNGKK